MKRPDINAAKTKSPGGAAYGRSLRGLGVNLLVTDVYATVTFLSEVFDLSMRYFDEDFAIVSHDGFEFMLHSDGTYAENPLLALTGDGTIRGAGIELRLYGIDPATASQKAEQLGHHILQPATHKGQGMSEAYIVGPDGYVWVPSLRDDI